MNPQQVPQPPPPQPQAPQPQQPAPAPQPVGQNPMQSAPTNQYVPAGGVPMAGQPKSRKGLFMILGIAGAALLVLILALVGWLMVWSPQAQSARASDQFMKSITSGDVTKALELSTENTSADTKEFIQKASDSTKGGYSLSSTKFKDSKRYTLYSLTNNDKKFARVIVEKEGGKWLSSSYVYSASALALVPGSVATESTDNQPTATTTTSTTTSCLVKTDFGDIYYANNGHNGRDTGLTDYSKEPLKGYGSEYNVKISFLPDSLNFSTESDYTGYNADVKVNSVADFYRAHPTQNYTIQLVGVVATTAPADLSFATQRAQKIQGMLIAAGVPSSKISLRTPENINTVGYGMFAGSTDEVTKRMSRSVYVAITPDKSCFDAATTSSSDR